MDNIKLFKSILGNVSDSFLFVDANGHILFANSAVCALFGYHNYELCNNYLSTLLQPNDEVRYNKYLQVYQQTKNRGKVFKKDIEVNAIKRNGKPFRARLILFCTEYRGEEVYAVIIQDLNKDKIVEERTTCLINLVTSLEQAKEDVNKSLLKEKEINHLKTRFVSMAAHEFRTPLSSIKLSVSLIERYYDRLEKKKVLNHLNKIKNAASNLNDTINDFLSIEKIEKGAVGVTNSNFSLRAFCENLISEVKMHITPGQKLTYHHHSEDINVTLDINLLRHIVINLLSNAIKYSGSTGVIKLETNVTESRCIIIVKDNGHRDSGRRTILSF